MHIEKLEINDSSEKIDTEATGVTNLLLAHVACILVFHSYSIPAVVNGNYSMVCFLPPKKEHKHKDTD